MNQAAINSLRNSITSHANHRIIYSSLPCIAGMTTQSLHLTTLTTTSQHQRQLTLQLLIKGSTSRRWRNMVVYRRAANNNIPSLSFAHTLECYPPHLAIDKQARNCNRNSGEQFRDKKITTNKSRREMRIRVSQEFNTKMHYLLWLGVYKYFLNCCLLFSCCFLYKLDLDRNYCWYYKRASLE